MILDNGSEYKYNFFYFVSHYTLVSSIMCLCLYAPSNSSQSLAATYRKHEKRKSRAYEQRVREIEHGSFTPLIMSATGGVGAAANVCYKRLASLLSVKWNMPYSCSLAWIRCKLSFSLLRSSIQCLRGSRSSPHTPMHPCHLVAFHESGITATGRH